MLCVELYASLKTRSANNIGQRISDLRVLDLFLFARCVWRRVMTMSSLHLMYTFSQCRVWCRNGEEWYRLRSSVQRLMLDLQSVGTFLPLVNPVADDFVQRMREIRDPETGIVDSLYNEIAKWNLECAFPLYSSTKHTCNYVACYTLCIGGLQGGLSHESIECLLIMPITRANYIHYYTHCRLRITCMPICCFTFINY